MIDNKLLDLTRDFVVKLQWYDHDLTIAKKKTVEQEEAVRQQYSQRISASEKRISDLERYRSDYADYIKKVHSRFEAIYDKRRRGRVDWVKSRFENLSGEVRKAENELRSPVEVDCYYFRLPAELWNALTDRAESKGPLKGLINTLMVLSLTGAVALAGYAIYQLWYEHVKLFGQPGSVGYLFYGNMLLYPILLLLGLNAVIYLLRICNRYFYGRRHFEDAVRITAACRDARQADLDAAKKELADFIENHSRYFSQGKWDPPALGMINFLDEIDQEILREAIGDMSSPYDSSLYEPKYVFKYTD